MSGVNLILLFLSGLLGVLLGGVIFGYILDQALSGELEVGDMATWAAGIGTISTLIFLIWQNFKSQIVQTAQENRLISHECEQQKMWYKQEEMLTFQKYKEHKKLFFDTLNELEREHNIKFYDRSGLYSKIFRNNNFDHCDMKVDLDESCDYAGSLKDTYNLFNRIKESLASSHFYDENKQQEHLESHLMYLIRLSSNLNISFNDNGHLGDIYWNVPNSKEHLALNLFDSLKTTKIMQSVFFELLKFTGNEELKTIDHLERGFFKEAIMELVHKKYKRSSFICDLKELDSVFEVVFSAYYIIKIKKYRSCSSLWELLNRINEFFQNKNNKHILEDNIDELMNLLRLQIDCFTFFHEKETDEEPFTELIDKTNSARDALWDKYYRL